MYGRIQDAPGAADHLRGHVRGSAAGHVERGVSDCRQTQIVQLDGRPSIRGLVYLENIIIVIVVVIIILLAHVTSQQEIQTVNKLSEGSTNLRAAAVLRP